MHESPENLLGYWMHRIGIAFKGHVDSSVQQLGIRGPDAMIMVRIAHEGSSSLVELSKMLGHAHTAILRHIDNLEEKGYLKRTPHPRDRRIKIVDLTEKGLDIVPQITSIVANIHQQALADFSKTENEQLFRFLRRLHNNLVDMDADSIKEAVE